MDQWPVRATAQLGRTRGSPPKETLLATWVGQRLKGRRRCWGSCVAHSPSMHLGIPALLHSKSSITTALLGFFHAMSYGTLLTLVLRIFSDCVISSMHCQSQLWAVNCTSGCMFVRRAECFPSKDFTNTAVPVAQPCTGGAEAQGSHKALALNPTSTT